MSPRKRPRIKPKQKRKWNRDVPDEILLCNKIKEMWKPALSLCPGLVVMDLYIQGIPEARAIIDEGYKFHEPVTVVQPL